MAVDVPTQLAIASARIAYFSPEVFRLEKYIWSNYGFYAQGLNTHSVVPSDGNLEPPDFPQLSVPDQPFGWGPFLAYFPPTMMTCMQVVIYNYPHCHPGFIVTFDIRLNGDLYKKQIAYGPHAERETFDWILIKENE